MSETSNALVLINRAARSLHVPLWWLRAEALAGRIPHLHAGGRFLVHVPTIERLLIERATDTGAGSAASDASAVGEEERRHQVSGDVAREMFAGESLANDPKLERSPESRNGDETAQSVDS